MLNYNTTKGDEETSRKPLKICSSQRDTPATNDHGPIRHLGQIIDVTA